MPIPSKHLTDHGLTNSIFMQKIVEARRSVGIPTPDLPSVPTLPDEKTRLLRARLILEEAIETINALGFSVDIPFTKRDLYESDKYHGSDKLNHAGVAIDIGVDEVFFEPRFEPDLTEIVDGCADVSVVVVGTLIACGIGDKPVLEEVDRNNLAKFGPGHNIRYDGKLLKPVGHTKPDFGRLIRDQTAEPEWPTHKD